MPVNFRVSPKAEMVLDLTEGEKKYLDEVGVCSGFTQNQIMRFVFQESIMAAFFKKQLPVDCNSEAVTVYEKTIEYVRRYNAVSDLVAKFGGFEKHGRFFLGTPKEIDSDSIPIDLRLKLHGTIYDAIWMTVDPVCKHLGLNRSNLFRELMMGFLDANGLLSNGGLVDTFEERACGLRYWQPYLWPVDPFDYMNVPIGPPDARPLPFLRPAEYAFLLPIEGQQNRAILRSSAPEPEGYRHWSSESEKIEKRVEIEAEKLASELKMKARAGGTSVHLPISEDQFLEKEPSRKVEIEIAARETVEAKYKAKLNSYYSLMKLDELNVYLRLGDGPLKAALPVLKVALGRSIPDLCKMLYVCYLCRYKVVDVYGVLTSDYTERLNQLPSTIK